MKLKVIQCNVGQYNLLSNEKKLSFSMAILDDDNKVIEDNSIKAIIYYYGDPDEYDDFRSAYSFDNLGEIFEKCYKYSDNVWGSTDYKSQCLLFAKLYQENYKEINDYHLKEFKEKTEKQIKQLQEDLKKNWLIDEISWYVNNNIEKDIKKYKDWINIHEKKLNDFKEETEGYIKELNQINLYKTKIEKLEKSLVKDYEYE